MSITYHKVIIAPINTQKTLHYGQDVDNKVKVFKVATWATKSQITQALQSIFTKLKIVKIRTTMMPAKRINFKNKPGTKAAWKKAYVKLERGFDIKFSE